MIEHQPGDAIVQTQLSLQRGSLQLDVDLALTAAATGIFGPSGAGKSTLLALIAGLTAPTRGSLQVRGETLVDTARNVAVPAHRRGIAVVFQEPRLFPHLNVAQNLAYGSTRRGTRTTPIDMPQLIELLELGPLLTRSPRNLSGGEKQRVNLARAIASAPRLLLLDEPLTAVDQALRSQVLPFLRKTWEEWNIPLLYVSHSFAEIEEVCTDVVVLDQGRVVSSGEVATALTDPEVLRVAGALGLDNFLRVTLGPAADPDGGNRTATVAGQPLLLAPSDRATGAETWIRVRPQDVILATAVPAGISTQNRLHGEVQRVDRLGARVLVTTDVGQPLRAEITPEAAAELALRPGVAVHCLIKTVALQEKGD
ncbi:MAG: molybdenum ABC transporter ATP-binding protein [Planctomycetota bacterium]